MTREARRRLSGQARTAASGRQAGAVVAGAVVVVAGVVARGEVVEVLVLLLELLVLVLLAEATSAGPDPGGRLPRVFSVGGPSSPSPRITATARSIMVTVTTPATRIGNRRAEDPTGSPVPCSSRRLRGT